MARPKKRTSELESLDPTKITDHLWFNLVDHFRAYYRASKQVMPTDDHLNFLLVKALLTRLHQNDPEEARQVYHEIQLLMAAEKIWNHGRSRGRRLHHPYMEIHEWMAYYGDRLYEIAFKPKANLTHWPPVFHMQRTLLERALRAFKYPERADEENQTIWLRDRGRKLDNLLHCVPCFCVYRFSIAEIEDKFFMDIGKRKNKLKANPNKSKPAMKPKTINQVVTALLAQYHGTSILNVEKLAKQATIEDVPIAGSFLDPVSKYTLDDIDRATTPPFPPFTSAD